MQLWAVHHIRYSEPFLKWTRKELKQMDQRTRKLMTMHKALHPRDDVDRLHVSREGGKALSSIEDNVDASIQRLRLHRKVRRRTVYSHRNYTDNTKTNRMTITSKQNWEDKQFYGRFKRLISNISHEKNVDVSKKKNLMRELTLFK